MRKTSYNGLFGAARKLAIEADNTAAVQIAAVQAGSIPEGMTAIVVEDPIGDAAEDLEASILDVNDEVAGIEAVDDEVDTAEEVADEMEVAAECLRDIAANGGLDKGGAAILNLYMKSLKRRVGMDRPTDGLVVESFGQTGSRAANTLLAIEEIEKDVASIWQQIIEFVEQSIAWVQGLFNKIFDAATQVKERGEKLATAATNIQQDGEKKESTFENDAVAGALAVGGSVGDVKSTIEELIKQLKDATGPVFDASIATANATLEAVKGGNLEALKSAVKPFNIAGAQAVEADAVGVSAAEGMKVMRGPALPGNKALVSISPEGDATVDQLAQTCVVVGTYDKAATVENAQLPVLSPPDAAAVAKFAADIGDLALEFQAKVKTMIDVKTAMVAEAKGKSGEQGSEEEGKMSGEDAIKLAKAVNNMTTQPAAPFLAYAVNTAMSYLHYVELSLKQYDSPVGGAPDGAPAADASAAGTPPATDTPPAEKPPADTPPAPAADAKPEDKPADKPADEPVKDDKADKPEDKK